MHQIGLYALWTHLDWVIFGDSCPSKKESSYSVHISKIIVKIIQYIAFIFQNSCFKNSEKIPAQDFLWFIKSTWENHHHKWLLTAERRISSEAATPVIVPAHSFVHKLGEEFPGFVKKILQPTREPMLLPPIRDYTSFPTLEKNDFVPSRNVPTIKDIEDSYERTSL